jgi:plasmid stabilization system protein ParE
MSSGGSGVAMAAELILAPETEHDIAAAYHWYEGQQPGLGEDFLRRVDACIQGILRSPEGHQIIHETYRRALVRRFPYAVFYEYSDDLVTVYCVFHTSREPQKWQQRLP